MSKGISKTTSSSTSTTLSVRRESGKIWSPIRQKWLVETPEERVRQEYLCVLINEYGFELNQIGEELDVGSIFLSHATRRVCAQIGIEKKEIKKGKPYQNYIEAAFGVQRRISSLLFTARSSILKV